VLTDMAIGLATPVFAQQAESLEAEEDIIVTGRAAQLYRVEQTESGRFDAAVALVVATLTGVDNDLLVADLLPQAARSRFDLSFALLGWGREHHASVFQDISVTNSPH
jgi:hypothetical protein